MLFLTIGVSLFAAFLTLTYGKEIDLAMGNKNTSNYLTVTILVVNNIIIFFRENQKEKKNVQQSIDRHGSLLWKEWFSHIITNMQENNNRIVWSFPSIFLGVFLNS